MYSLIESLAFYTYIWKVEQQQIRNLEIMMNKILSTLFVIIAFATLTMAQIKVVAPNGDVGVGVDNPTEKLDVGGLAKTEGMTVEATGASGTTVYERTDGAAVIIGAGITGAGFTFDNDYRFEVRSRGRSFILNRNLSAGSLLIRGVGSTGFVGIAGVTNPSTELHVGGSITYMGSLINASDARLKSNVNKYAMGLEQIMQLRPVSYNYNGKAGSDSEESHIGLIAQDLQKVAPELVSTFIYEEEDELGYVTLSEEYLQIKESGIKYMLVNAIQDQQEMIEDQSDEIEDLKEQLEDLKELVNTLIDKDDVQQSIQLNGANGSMLQNQPNPFSNATTIKYAINDNVQNAIMQILDINGRVIKTVQLDITKNGAIDIKENDLPSGTYSYSLIADGKLLDTKQMVISK